MSKRNGSNGRQPEAPKGKKKFFRHMDKIALFFSQPVLDKPSPREYFKYEDGKFKRYEAGAGQLPQGAGAGNPLGKDYNRRYLRQ